MTSYSLLDIAKIISAKIVGNDQGMITRLASIKSAGSGDLTFLADSAYRQHLVATRASAVILSADNATDCPVTALIVANPALAFARVAHLFDSTEKPKAGVHPAATLAKTAMIHPSAWVGPGCVIGERVVVGQRTVIHAGSTLHDDVSVGDDCIIHSHVVLYHGVSLANRVILHSGAVIGADGFGLVRNQQAFEKMPHLGSVVIADDVEVGANSCVDRGALDDTVIEVGVKIDNLVQIAHNVVIGAHTVIAGCTCIAGSTVIGAHCTIAGAVAIAGHLTICAGTVFTGGATVTKSVQTPGIYSSGTGMLPHAQWRKCAVHFRRGAYARKS